ncbi:MAG: TIGR04372 family glycosyltransferase [Candidatus Latescibacteria bacterium]|nr:TIGR04372 family glycosyltransferase [Candidatus Latescibacterota bacterium]
MPEASEIKGVKFAKELGLPENAPYVCLHVRETGFYGAKEGRGKTTRNGSIDNYLDAINYLTSRGLWVVRLGDPSMTPLPRMSNVIDYPFSRFKCDLMDIWLIKHCALYVGQDSGPMNVAILFEKTILSTNIVDVCCGSPLRTGDRGILKHVFSRKKSRHLSVKEVIEGVLSRHNDFINDPDFVFVENSPEEILELITEYFDDRKAITGESEKTYIQRCVDSQREQFDSAVDWLNLMSDAERDRFLAAFCASSGKLSNKFLEKFYWSGQSN